MDHLTPEDEAFWEDDFEDDELEEPEPSPAWRRPALIAIAAVTALAVALVPLWNLLGPGPRVSGGLEVCGFDYCTVQEAVTDAGLLPLMNGLTNEFLTDEETWELADATARVLGVDPVRVEVVDRLEDSLGGVYHPASRTVTVKRPVRAWTLAHEMAHVVSTGHGEDFTAALITIARWWDEGRP